MKVFCVWRGRVGVDYFVYVDLKSKSGDFFKIRYIFKVVGLIYGLCNCLFYLEKYIV